MKSVSWLLARRYLLNNAYNSGISQVISICFTAIFISAFCLALVAAIMKGLEHATEKSMQSIYPSLMIRAYGQPLNSQAIINVVQEQFPTITHLSPQAERHILVYNEHEETEPFVISLVGIQPETERLVSKLESKIINSHPHADKNLLCCLYNDQILVGLDLAKQLGINVGETITILVPATTQTHAQKMHFTQEKCHIGGIFHTGMNEYDAHVVYCSLNFLAKLFPDFYIEQLNLATTHDANEKKIKHDLRAILDLEVLSWQDLHPAIVEALTLEKYVAFIISILITLIASMNIVSLFCMYTKQKKVDIALLQTLGCTDIRIRKIFVYISVMITSLATIAGLIAASICSLIIDKTQCIALPDAYYTTYVPAEMTFSIACTVFGLILVISTTTALCAIGLLPRTTIAQTLRFEG